VVGVVHRPGVRTVEQGCQLNLEEWVVRRQLRELGAQRGRRFGGRRHTSGRGERKSKICDKVERKREGRFNTRVRTPPLLFRKVPVPGSSTTIMRPAIALLICGGLTGFARERNGDYLDIYQTFLKDTSSTDFTLDPYFVARDPSVLPDEDQYDCIVLTGSGIVSLSLTNLSLMLYPSYFPHAQTFLVLLALLLNAEFR
jgi:hypothetical protein